MKKTILVFSALLTLAITLGGNSQTAKASSDITLGNIEALSLGEGSSVKCVSSGSVDCPISNIKVLYVIQY